MDLSKKISRGIITGYNDAFIIEEETKLKLESKDPNSTEIIKPLLRGKDVKRYGYTFAGIYVLSIGFGMYKDLEVKYPAVYEHLKKHEAKLKARGQCKSSRSGKRISADYDGQHHWLELDNNPSEAYLREFEEEKVIWPETMRIHRTGNSNFPRFNIKKPGIYLDKTVFMMEIKNPKFFVGMINSKMGWKIIDMYVDKLDNGGYMMQKAMVEKLPVPDPDEIDASIVREVESLVGEAYEARENGSEANISNIEEQIDNLVFKIYDLSESEINLVKETAR